MSIERTTKGLSEALFNELELLQDGEVTPQHARSFAGVAGQICSISKLEMDYTRFVSNDRLASPAKKLKDGVHLKSVKMAK